MPAGSPDLFLIFQPSGKHPIAPPVIPVHCRAMMKDKISHFNGKRPAHRILVVDGDDDTRRLNTEVLIQFGYHVDAAKDDTAGWAALQLNSYDLLVTDNNMPKVSGVELLMKLRAARMALPVIMATATLPKKDLTRYSWLLPAVTLPKPYTVDELLGTVKKVLHTTSGVREQHPITTAMHSGSLVV
jgi:DNA-binding response OmpR family regulator